MHYLVRSLSKYDKQAAPISEEKSVMSLLSQTRKRINEEKTKSARTVQANSAPTRRQRRRAENLERMQTRNREKVVLIEACAKKWMMKGDGPSAIDIDLTRDFCSGDLRNLRIYRGGSFSFSLFREHTDPGTPRTWQVLDRLSEKRLQTAITAYAVWRKLEL